MKKIILPLLLFSSLFCRAQDSATVVISVTLQARDIEYIATITATNPSFEDLDSAFKSKWRPPAVAPTGTNTTAIGGGQVRDWLQLADLLRSDYMALTETPTGSTSLFTRVNTAIRAAATPWLTLRLNRGDSNYQDYFQSLRRIGRERLSRIRAVNVSSINTNNGGSNVAGNVRK